MFAFAIGTDREIRRQKYIPLVCILGPVLTWLISENSATLLGGFTFGNLLVALNGLICFTGLWLISDKKIPHVL